MRPFFYRWLLIFTGFLFLFGCSSEIPNDFLDKAAKQIVLDLENKSSKNISSNPTVYILDFTNLVNGEPNETSIKILSYLNHYISNSKYFRLLEFDDHNRKALLKMLEKNESDLQDINEKPELGKFINLHYVFRGGVEKIDNKIFVRASMISLETGEIIHSSQVSIEIEKNKKLYFYILFCIFFICILFYVKFNKFTKRININNTMNIFPKKCASCGKKINSINSIGGQCLTAACENDICVNCWNEANSRYCKDCAKK